MNNNVHHNLIFSNSFRLNEIVRYTNCQWFLKGRRLKHCNVNNTSSADFLGLFPVCCLKSFWSFELLLWTTTYPKWSRSYLQRATFPTEEHWEQLPLSQERSQDFLKQCLWNKPKHTAHGNTGVWNGSLWALFCSGRGGQEMLRALGRTQLIEQTPTLSNQN